MTEMKERIRYLFYLLANQEDYLRAEDLAKQAGVSERTVKSDMTELAMYAKETGAHLLSKKGKGYRLSVVNNEKYTPLINQLNMHYYVMGSGQVNVKIRCNEILRRLIVEENYMSIEMLANELFLTESSIREELKMVKKHLSQFHLRWKEKHESGPLIQGEEFDRRMLMLCVFEIHYHESAAFYKNVGFLHWFDCEESKRYEIRHIFLKQLRQSKCHIRDEHTERLSRYLCLMANRVKCGYFIRFTEEQRRYIRKLKQCQVAYRVIYDLMSFSGYDDLPDDEILAFGVLLAQWADISIDCDLEVDYPDQFKEANTFLREYEQVLWNDYGVNLEDFSNYEQVMLTGIIPLIIQKEFKSCSQPIRITYEKDSRIKECPLAAQMAYDAIFLFERKYNIELSEYNALTLSSHLHSLLLSIEYDFKPVRALVCNKHGFSSCYGMAKLIKARYEKAFEKLDCYEFYELRGLNVADYDCVIMNHPIFSYKYDWPYLYVDTVPTQKQMDEIYNQLIIQSVKFKKAVHHLHLEKMNIYRQFHYDGEDSFIKLLSYKLGKDDNSIKAIQRSLHFRSSVCVYNKVCVLFIKRKFVSKSIFDIYQLNNESRFSDETMNYIVVMSFDFEASLQSARYINDVIYMLFNNEESIGKLIEKENTEGLSQLVQASLKSLPIALN